MKKKKLCDWQKKDIEKHAAELLQIISKPKFFCLKCARATHDAAFVCKPHKIKD